MQNPRLTADFEWLNATFARNRALFGGFAMKLDDAGNDDGTGDDDDSGTDGADKPDAGKADKGADADKPLGANGEKALKAERDARKALENELAGLKKGLLGALGADDDKGDDGDALAKIQERLDAMQHENVVLALANEHRIIDKDDLALLKATKDPDALKTLAARLAPGEDDGKGGKGRTPKPDGSQGGGDAADTKPSVARGREMFEASRKKKSA